MPLEFSLKLCRATGHTVDQNIEKMFSQCRVMLTGSGGMLGLSLFISLHSKRACVCICHAVQECKYIEHMSHNTSHISDSALSYLIQDTSFIRTPALSEHLSYELSGHFDCGQIRGSPLHMMQACKIQLKMDS